MEKKILMIVYTNYPTDTRVRREAETLSRLPEYSVSVLSLKSKEKPVTYSLDGVQVIELNEQKYYGKNQVKYVFSYVRFLVLSLFKCTELFFSEKIKTVHVHNMPNFLVFSAIIPRLFGKKVILDTHDTVPETYATKFSVLSGWLFRLLCLEERVSCAFAHKIISVNSVQREALIARGISKDKITISMNVLDHRIFNSQACQTNTSLKTDGLKMVYHGTIAKRLGVDLIIRSMADSIKYFPDLEFHIWGSGGGDLDEIAKLSKKPGFVGKVQFHDALPMRDLIPKLLGMTLGVVGNRKSPATELMLPVKMLEYVALGIPVVAPRLKAVQHYFTEEMVSYFEPDDIESMTRAILRLLERESLRKSQAVKAKAFLDQYGWEKHQKSLIDLYNNL